MPPLKRHPRNPKLSPYQVEVLQALRDSTDTVEWRCSMDIAVRGGTRRTEALKALHLFGLVERKHRTATHLSRASYRITERGRRMLLKLETRCRDCGFPIAEGAKICGECSAEDDCSP